jgi:hypothetical protein
MDAEQLKAVTLSRRSALKKTAGAAFLLSQAAIFEQLAFAPVRASAATAKFSDIQYDLGSFLAAPQVFNDGAGNVTVGLPPVYSVLLPARLNRTPGKGDQATLANALAAIEGHYAPSPSGVLIFSVSYGLPYFGRLPRSLVKAHMPTLLANSARPVLEEAVASPTDVVRGLVGGLSAPVPNVRKDRFNVDVRIESNDVLLQFRSDNLSNLSDVTLWLQGSNSLNGSAVASPRFAGLFSFQTARIQFVQQGLPRKLADNAGFEFAGRMNPDSTMAMGFVDQQVNAAGPAAITTFAGNSSAHLTSAKPGDYFDNGSIAHFSHNIEDLFQFYATPNQDSRHPDGETFAERCQYAFNSNQLGTANGIPAAGNKDQFTDGGGPAFINNVFQGTGAAAAGAADTAGLFTPDNATLDATFTGEGRIGHNAALQRASRAPDGTPLHIRVDGPGLDSMDVPAFRTFPGSSGVHVQGGSKQFKLQFMIFVPTADTFARMRTSQAAQDLQVANSNVDPDDNGFERFITATRRQNFLVPPRRNRSFPLVELG